MLPHIPAAREAARIPILDMSSKAPSPKARVAMNNDMVKPIPHNEAAPRIFPHPSSAGDAANRIFADNQAENHISTGLPTNNPRATPRQTGCVAAVKTFPSTGTPALANANSGITRKLTQG
jgi:hypothetical protein